MPGISAGFCFYLEVPGEVGNNHIWTVVTDPDPESEEIVIVNFTSVKKDKPIYDNTTVVEPDEFGHVLTKQSYMFYSESRVLSVSDLKKILHSDFADSRESCPPNLSGRIQDGILTSRQTPAKIKKIVRGLLKQPQK